MPLRLPTSHPHTPPSQRRPFAAILTLTLITTSPADPATATPATNDTTTTGITEPARDATLGAPVDGIVSAIHLREGDTAEQDTVILELRHDLEKIEVSRQETILAAAEKRLQRITKLFANSETVSEEELEEAQAKFQLAQADHSAAVAQLERHLVRAPFAGTVTDLFDLEVGEAVQPQSPLARLIEASSCRLVCHLESHRAANLQLGQSVKLTLGSGPRAIHRSATIDFIAPVVDPASGLLKITAAFDNPDGAVRPGVTGTMTW